EERQTLLRVFRSRERSHERRPLRFTSQSGHAPTPFWMKGGSARTAALDRPATCLAQVQSPLAAGAEVSAAGEASPVGSVAGTSFARARAAFSARTTARRLRRRLPVAPPASATGIFPGGLAAGGVKPSERCVTRTSACCRSHSRCSRCFSRSSL